MSATVHSPRSVLITGAAGFIGSNLVHRLLHLDDRVRIVAFDKLTYAGSLDNLVGAAPDRYTFVQGDICDATLVAKLIREHQIDTILHLAAESHVDRSIDGPAAFVQTNVVGTYAMLEAARTVWLIEGLAKTLAQTGQTVRFHHVSTDEVYGDLDLHEPGFTETTPYQPSSPYSASKAGSDHLVRAWGRTFALPATLSNCSNNYGPRQHAEKLIPTVVRKCLQRQPIPVYGKGDNVRDWLYVVDHCDALWHIVRHGGQGETYNVGGNNEWSNLQLVQTLATLTAQALGVPADELLGLITFVTDRPGHDRRYAIDASKLAGLGWEPTTAFHDGLLTTILWYIDKFRREGLVEPGRLGLQTGTGAA
ncbi:MAG: dTDP-glucose 4,6-dehydratase [Deltaproteobacteria bacterium]|nr:dTDP-glucose 4,6-dehydratase [Deltaproteobacteria bacterium]